MKRLLMGLTLLSLSLLPFISANAQVASIRFGVGYFYPPFVTAHNNGQSFTGFDIDVALALCKVLNAQCTFTPMTLTDLFKSLDEGKVDALISAMSITPGRRAKYDFTLPYFKSSMSFMSLASANTNLSPTPEGLKDKTIGVIVGSAFEIYLRQNYGDKIKIKTFSYTADALDSLTKGKVDLLLLDTPVARYWVNNSSGIFKIVSSPENYNLPYDEGFGIAVKSGNTALAQALNNALVTIVQNGTYDQIKQRYFQPFTINK